MKKQERNGVWKTFLFGLSDISLQRYDSINRQLILEKRFFTQLAVVHCDPSSSQVWLTVGGGGRTSICGMAKDEKILVF